MTFILSKWYRFKTNYYCTKMKKRNALITLFSIILLFSFIKNSYGVDSLKTVQFSHPNIIRYDHHGFIINGKRVYIFSAGFHYFRTPPALWNDRLDKIAAAGFNTVETYIPWNYHEQKPGQTNFDELNNFLDACAAHHLWVIIRPGPYICAEWNAGGFPNWLAYKEIGYRTDTPLDIKWSRHWYNEVLPVVRKHLITHGGNVILLQLENEYDYSGLPDTLRTNYLRSLYHDALENKIDVPLITCWTSVSRNNTDPALSQIMDADNFYPGYHLNGVGHSIQTMIRTEPYSPAMITELQGGWFSGVGGKAIRYPDQFGAAQVNDLTKYVIARGVDAFNYYMGYGGTNFGYWGALGITNSYDYTAPISEVGGLWKKYRSVKLIGDFLKLAGPEYEVLPEIMGAAKTSTPGIELILRGNNERRILFVRNETDTAKTANITVRNGNTSTDLTVDMPKYGAKFLFLDESLKGVKIRNANIQFSQADKIGKTSFLLAYGQKGEQASFSENGEQVNKLLNGKDQWLPENGSLIGLTSWKRASKTRFFSSGDNSISVTSDSYLINKKRISKNRFNLNVQTLPGSDHFVIVSAKKARRVTVNGHREHVSSRKEGHLYLNTFDLNTSTSPFRPIPVRKADVELNPGKNGSQGKPVVQLKDGSYGSLGMNGLYDNGYYVYVGTSALPSRGFLKVRFYNNDWHGVYIDGKFVPALSGNSYSNSMKLSGLRVNGSKTHSIKIIYEDRSRLNFPDVIRKQLKGLVSISYMPKKNEQELSTWKLSPHPAGLLNGKPAESQTWFDDRYWPELKVQDWRTLYKLGLANQTSSWYRNYFTLSPEEAANHHVSLDFQAVYGDATVFINGKKVTEHKGRFTSFDVPLTGLVHAGQNVVAVYINNNNGLGGLYRPAIVKFDVHDLPVYLKLHEGLAGQNSGWYKPGRVSSFNGKQDDIDQSLSHGGHLVWYKISFDLSSNRGWNIPLAAEIKATGDALIWINGHLQGRYSAQGPQKLFFLPKSWLKEGRNTLTLVLRPAAKFGDFPVIKSLSIVASEKYVSKNNTLSVSF